MPELTWIGKDQIRHHHLDVPFRPLVLQYQHVSADFLASTPPQNLVIQGDNLHALKSLLPEYEGRVKCIYIDPPYNTGNEGWVYNDNVSDPRLLRWLHEVVGKEGEDLSRHDKWLCMMYPRLKLLHKLLAEDGAIFVSIDDVEAANLKLVMDEIFGPTNFVANIIWQKNYSPKNSAKHFSVDHDFIVAYAKSGDVWRPNLMGRSDEQLSRYKNPDNDPRGPWKPGDLSARNPYSLGTYPITTPSGRVITGPPKGNYWRYSAEKLKELDADNRIWWGKEGNNAPAVKRFLSEVQGGIVPQTLWTYAEVGHTQDAKKEINRILHDVDTFPTPKPTKLLERIVELTTDTDSIVLDSFAGSGTTMHAVLNLNVRDGGRRQCILIEMEDYAETVTAERVRRVIDGYGNTPGTGGQFAFCALGEPLFDPSTDLLQTGAPLDALRRYVWYTETAMALPVFEPGTSTDHPAYLGTAPDGSRLYLHYAAATETTLDRALLGGITVRAPRYVIYADACAIDAAWLQQQNVVFKKIPRDITRF